MMAGLATETIVESTRIMKKPTNIAHRVSQGFGGRPADGFDGCSRAVVALMTADAASRTGGFSPRGRDGSRPGRSKDVTPITIGRHRQPGVR